MRDVTWQSEKASAAAMQTPQGPSAQSFIVKYDERLLDCNLKGEKTYKPETHSHM